MSFRSVSPCPLEMSHVGGDVDRVEGQGCNPRNGVIEVNIVIKRAKTGGQGDGFESWQESIFP